MRYHGSEWKAGQVCGQEFQRGLHVAWFARPRAENLKLLARNDMWIELDCASILRG